MSVTINGDTGVSAVQDGIIKAEDLAGAQSGAAPIFGVRAWCTFNGTTAGTNAPISGGNVSSVTRNSTGDYTINFGTSLATTTYGVQGLVDASLSSHVNNANFLNVKARTTGSIQVTAVSSGGTLSDYDFVSVWVIE